MTNYRDIGKDFGKSAKRGRDVAALTFVHLAQTEQFDEITILEQSDLFPKWDLNWTGKAGTILQDEGQLYKSIHNVGVGQNTKPSETPSMWTRIGNPLEEYPEWIQPLGGHDAYGIGAKVNHNGKNWISNIANNIWQPSVYGWDEVV
jgi:hypothetical protein